MTSCIHLITMPSSEMGNTIVLSLLNIGFLGNAVGYTPETNLGKCFEGTSEGYILLFDRSFVDCVRECKRRPRCEALRYDRRILVCMLYPTDQIPRRNICGCHQAFRWEFINQYVIYETIWYLIPLSNDKCVDIFSSCYCWIGIGG